jgi:hypothetical protein
MNKLNHPKIYFNNLVIRIFGSLPSESEGLNLSPKGYIAISSVLVIAAVVLIIGTTVSLISISEGQISLSSYHNDTVLDGVEGCTEDALLYLNENNSLPATITTPQITCTVTVNSQAGSNWTITVTGTVSGHTKSIQVQLTRTTTIAITSWQEI